MEWKESNDVEEDLSISSILIFMLIGLVLISMFFFFISKSFTPINKSNGYVLEISDEELKEIEFGDGRK